HANDAGRYAVEKLELEAKLVDGWVRFWFRGEMVLLPAELNATLTTERAARVAAEQRAVTAEQQAAAAVRERAALEAELARLREELARSRGGA
ncbi:MAG TPA: hypothetical protein VH092_29595, partial [Urbifossiella sp.]|nr:hypothetical protein [Urbifossiella sp.]